MTYKVLGMLRETGLGKDMNSGVHVPYLSAVERRKYQVTFKNGIPWWASTPLDTTDGVNELYIFVMDGNGDIYTADKSGIAHHSAFLSGNPVASAGHWKVTQGNVEYINSNSGHYQPPSDYAQQIITELNKQGVKTDQTETNFGLTSQQYIVGFKRFKGITGLKWWEIERGATKVTDYATGVTDKDGNQVEIGEHVDGQRLRLYPGYKPQWTWF